MQTRHMKVLAIDPGSTSTKLGLFDDDKPIYKESLFHNVEELSRFSTSFEQKDFRTQAVLEFLAKNNVDLKTIDAVIGRGGIVKPLRAGTYTVNEAMLEDLRNSPYDHPSNIGAVIELEIEGQLGGGISITPIKNGKMVDTSGASDGGPFSPQRGGGLPTTSLIKFCLRSGMNEKQLLDYVTKKGGLASYLGVNDLRKATEMIDAGNKEARLVVDAMCYQIAKEIGAMATVLKGTTEAILLTGGMAFDKKLISDITERVGWIAPVKVYPGEEELEALAGAALRVLRAAPA